MKRVTACCLIALAAMVLTPGCRDPEASGPAKSIRLATTTSTENSGLLDVLLPAFKQTTGIEVQVMPMGTGKALRTARDGNCDVVLVHAPQAERDFVAQGWGVARRAVMYNDFVLLGPTADPAAIQGASSAAEAMKKIADAEATFVSRGDNSGTHKKEQSLWSATEVKPDGQWFRSVGKGMGETLIMADQMKAHVLADRGTYLKFRGKIDLAVLVSGGDQMHNPYGVIAVNPRKWPHVPHDAAIRFIEFLTSDEARELIAAYKVDGEVLFHPWPKDKPAP